MFVIGLTGNFGTGKTTVSNILAELGAAAIHADEVGNRMLMKDSPVYKQILDHFGSRVLDKNGEIDRRLLGEITFNNKDDTLWLNKTMHPPIVRFIKGKIEEYRHSGVQVLVLEVIVLNKGFWTPVIDELWVTTAPREVIIERLGKNRGYSEEEIKERLQRQMSPQELVQQADVVIDTNCTLEELRIKVTDLWQKLMVRISR